MNALASDSITKSLIINQMAKEAKLIGTVVLGIILFFIGIIWLSLNVPEYQPRNAIDRYTRCLHDSGASANTDYCYKLANPTQ